MLFDVLLFYYFALFVSDDVFFELYCKTTTCSTIQMRCFKVFLIAQIIIVDMTDIVCGITNQQNNYYKRRPCNFDL